MYACDVCDFFGSERERERDEAIKNKKSNIISCAHKRRLISTRWVGVFCMNVL